MRYIILIITLIGCQANQELSQGPEKRKETKRVACWSESFDCQILSNDHNHTGYNYLACSDPITAQYEQNVYIPSTEEIDDQTQKIHDAVAEFYSASVDTWPWDDGWAYASRHDTFYGSYYDVDTQSSLWSGQVYIHRNFKSNVSLHVATDWLLSNDFGPEGPTTLIKIVDDSDPNDILNCQ